MTTTTPSTRILPPPSAPLDSLASLPHTLIGWRAWYAMTIGWNLLVHLSAAVASAGAAYAVAAAVGSLSAPADTAGARALLMAPTAVVLGATLLRAAAQWQESFTSHDLSFRVMARIRMWIFQGLARVAPAGLTGRRRGDVTATAMGYAESLEVFLAHSSLYILGRVIATPIMVGALAVLNLRIALATIPFLLAMWLVPALTRRLSLSAGARAREVLAAMASDMQENVGAIREIVAFGLLPQRRERLRTLQRDLHSAQRTMTALHAISTALAAVISSLLVIAATAVGVGEVAAGRLDLVWLPPAVALAGASPSAIVQWMNTTRHRGNTAAAARRIEQVLHAPDPLPVRSETGKGADGTLRTGGAEGRTGAAAPGEADGAALVVDRVSFTWPGAHRPAVKNVSLSIAPGETVALAGRSGSGKSTLGQLMARWIDPEKGAVRVAGTDVRSIDRAELPSRTQLVAQEPHLFAETVRENLQLAAAEPVGDAQLWEALETAGAADVVRRLPEGLDTVLADHGRSFSGGERQRLALARTVLAPSPVLVLDESVSQLDTGTAASIQRSLLGADRATVLIAHRLVTLLHAQRIIVLEDGAIVGDGTHDQLLDTCPAYRALVAPQMQQDNAGAREAAVGGPGE